MPGREAARRDEKAERERRDRATHARTHTHTAYNPAAHTPRRWVRRINTGYKQRRGNHEECEPIL